MREINIYNEEDENLKYRLRHFITGKVLTLVKDENNNYSLAISNPNDKKISRVSFFSTGSDSKVVGFNQYYKLLIGDLFIHANHNLSYHLPFDEVILNFFFFNY